MASSESSPFANPDPLVMTCTHTGIVTSAFDFLTRAILCSICSTSSRLGCRVPHRSFSGWAPGDVHTALASTTVIRVLAFMRSPWFGMCDDWDGYRYAGGGAVSIGCGQLQGK